MLHCPLSLFHRGRLARGFLAALTAVVLALAALPLMAGPQAAYRNDPTQLSTDPSMRSQVGWFKPLLVDDFVAAHGSHLHRIHWWGSEAADDRWLVALFDHEPVVRPCLCDPTDPGLGQGLYADALAVYTGYVAGIEDDPFTLPGVFRFTTWKLNGPVLEIGQRYWLSIANFGPDWYWAQAQGEPSVGWKQDGARALCLDGKLPCEQWADVGTDLAFLIVVPEPGTLALLAIAMLPLLRQGRRAVS